MSEELKLTLSMIGTLILMIAVFVGAFYVSKWVAKKYQPAGAVSAGNIEILDRKQLGKDQCLMLVRVGGKVYFLGVCAQQITKIEEVDSQALTFTMPKEQAQPEFLKILKDAFKNQTLKK